MAIVPPGGFAGFSQMTPASRASWFRPGRSSGSGKRRSSKSGRRKTKTSARRKRASTRKLKFGSPGWQKKYKVGRFAKKR